MERGYSDNREQDSDYESDCGTSIPGLSIENDFGVGSLLPIATRMRESFAKAMERNCDQRYYASVMIVNESKKILKKKFTIFNHPFNTSEIVAFARSEYYKRCQVRVLR